jgi:hypothetical protein
MSVLIKIAIVATFAMTTIQPAVTTEVASDTILIASFSGSVGSLAGF